MAERTALLLRAICGELTARILPELRSADAIERVNLTRQVLQDLAAEVDVLPTVAVDLAPAFRAAIGGALDALPQDLPGALIGGWRDALGSIPSQSGAALQLEIAALRALAATIVRELADVARDTTAAGSSAAIDAALVRLGAIDQRWLTTFAAASSQPQAGPGRPDRPGAAAGAAPATDGPPARAVTSSTVTTYLRRAFPRSSQIAATEVIEIPGGRSKKTFFVTITGTDELPAHAVIRQDYALKYEGTKVRDEFKPLSKLAALGLPVPRPWHLEPAESELGPPFLIVDRLAGSAPGTYFGLQKPCPGAFREMARTLATLHRIAPRDLGFADAAPGTNSLEGLIDQYQRKWRSNATSASPLVDYAYAWARREARREPGRAVVVHGDAGPYNFLIDDDHLTAVLDWEFAHLGDPAEDLGIVRVYAENVMDWNEFLGLYAAAGGSAVPEHRVRLAMVLQFLKGTTLVAASGRNFEEGWTREFVKGASSFTGLKLIEQRIAHLLGRFQAL